MPDYEKDGFNRKEKCKAFLQGIVILAFLSYMFYRSVFAFLILLPLLWFYMKWQKANFLRKQKELLGIQFKELLQSLLAGIQAGYSIENAFGNAYADIALLYGEDAMLAKELLHIKKALRNNRTVEDLVMDLALRSHHPDLMEFAEVFQVAKRSGGNLPGMMKTTTEILTAKMEVKRKISTVISSKKMEQSIMNVVPFGILLYINASSPGFFDVLYHNVTGIIIMTILLLVYLAAYFLAEKIIRIDI